MDSSKQVNDNQPNKRCRLNSTDDGKHTKNARVPIRTVYIRGIRIPKIGDEVKGYFEQFGEIESVIVRSQSTYSQYGFVQFKRAEDAETALQCTEKPWRDFEVKAADPWHQPDHPLQVPPEQDSKSNITVALNDHCLQEIFKYLSSFDYTNVAEVCKRFNAQAKITFAMEHKQLDLYRELRHHKDLVETAIKHFGKYTESLNISAESFQTETEAIRSIGLNFGPKLKEIRLHHFRFETDLEALRPIFAGIERLELVQCSDSIGLGQLMAGCTELKSLTLTFYRNGSENGDPCIMQQTYPKLQELAMAQNKVTVETFDRFVIRHPKLVKLSIEHFLSTRVFRTIGQHAKNLQEFVYTLNYDRAEIDDQFQIDAAFIGQLNSLKKLELHLCSCPIVPVLNALIDGNAPIEFMDMTFHLQLLDDDPFECISRLKTIKQLKLWMFVIDRRTTDADVIKLANLPKLEELYLGEEYEDSEGRFSDTEFASELSATGLQRMLLHSTKLKSLELYSIDSIKIGIDEYNVMLSTVQERKEKVPLFIKIHSSKDQVDVPVAMLAENRNTFNIEEIHFERSF